MMMMQPHEQWEADWDELAKLTVKELKQIARDEGICLGYDASTKRGTIQEILSQRRHRELSGYANRNS